MTLKKNSNISTHENVTIEYETANLGSRFLANLLDNTIFYATLAIIVIILIVANVISSDVVKSDTIDIEEDNLFLSVSIVILIYFLFRNFYNVLFDMIMKGQTPGKKAVGIRVVSITGEPINFTASFIRNLMRAVDSLPASYLVGSIILILNSKSQRLGDIVANTMVIKIRSDAKFSKKLNTIISEDKTNEVNMEDILNKYITQDEPINEVIPVTENINNDTNEKPTINREEYEILSEYLKKRENMPDTQVNDIKMFNYFFRRIGAEIPKSMYLSYVLLFLRETEYYNSKFYKL